MSEIQTRGTEGWIKARRSISTNACVEMRCHGGGIQVRDSKDPSGAVLSFTGAEFAAWLEGAKNAEFDHLLGDLGASV